MIEAHQDFRQLADYSDGDKIHALYLIIFLVLTDIVKSWLYPWIVGW